MDVPLTADTLRSIAGSRTGVGLRRGHAEGSDRRTTDYRLGRQAARDALAELGYRPRSIGVGDAGEPLWPPGVAGSIAHTTGIAVAVVGPRSVFAAIGVDVEPEGRSMGPRTTVRICTSAELEWVRASADPDREALRLFCVKEAVYKAYSPIGVRLGFRDVEVARGPGGVLHGRLALPSPPDTPPRFAASTLVAGGYVVACVLLREGSATGG